MALRRFHLRAELLARLWTQAKVSNTSIRALQSQCYYRSTFWSFSLRVSYLLDVYLLKALRIRFDRDAVSAKLRHVAAKVPQALGLAH